MGGFCLVVLQQQKEQFSKMTKNFIHVSSRQLVLARGGGGGDGQEGRDIQIWLANLFLFI